MAKNHYESAFECYLRELGAAFFSNRQEYRNRFGDGSTLKNFDFVVTDHARRNWIIDVKGRRFPGGRRQNRYWKNWTTEDDLAGLLKWESFLGSNFRGLFVFAFLVEGDCSPLPVEQLYARRKRRYAFVAVDLHDFIAEARLISPQWKTYELPARRFRSLARPFVHYLS